MHGHNFVCKVTLKGKPDSQSGMIMNASSVKTILKDTFINDFDHHYLNDIVEFKTTLPTTEMICKVIWDRLKPHFGLMLYEVYLKETETIEVFYRG